MLSIVDVLVYSGFWSFSLNMEAEKELSLNSLLLLSVSLSLGSSRFLYCIG